MRELSNGVVTGTGEGVTIGRYTLVILIGWGRFYGKEG